MTSPDNLNHGEPFIHPEGFTEYWFKNDTWNMGFHLLVGCSVAHLREWTKENYQYELGDDDRPLEGSFVDMTNEKGTAYVIQLSEPWKGSIKQIGTLSHELLHLVMRALSARGIWHTRATEEAYCYLHECLLKWCINALEGYNDSTSTKP